MLIVWAEFFARHSPVSTIANPACMNITRKPAIKRPDHVDREQVVGDAVVEVGDGLLGGDVAFAVAGGRGPDAGGAAGGIGPRGLGLVGVGARRNTRAVRARPWRHRAPSGARRPQNSRTLRERQPTSSAHKANVWSKWPLQGPRLAGGWSDEVGYARRQCNIRATTARHHRRPSRVRRSAGRAIGCKSLRDKR